jgi:hypothetical protein
MLRCKLFVGLFLAILFGGGLGLPKSLAKKAEPEVLSSNTLREFTQLALSQNPAEVKLGRSDLISVEVPPDGISLSLYVFGTEKDLKTQYIIEEVIAPNGKRVVINGVSLTSNIQNTS